MASANFSEFRTCTNLNDESYGDDPSVPTIVLLELNVEQLLRTRVRQVISHRRGDFLLRIYGNDVATKLLGIQIRVHGGLSVILLS